MYVGDIISSTRNTSGGLTDSIGLYRWTKNGTTFTTYPVFLYGIVSLNESTQIIPGGTPYTAFNPLSSPITLRIPPDGKVLSPLNPFGPLAKKTSAAQWCVRINVNSNNIEYVSSIYCASMPVPGIRRWYPVSPSFASLKAGIINSQNGNLYGNTASGDLTGGGCMFELKCSNSSAGTVPVTTFIDQITGLAPDIKAGLFTPNGTKIGVHDTLAFSISPQSTIAYYLIVGNDDYVKRTSALLNSKLTFRIVNFGRGLLIRYTVPCNTRNLEFVLYDLKGRCIWKQSRLGGALPQDGTILVTQPVAAGFYLVELRTMTLDSRVPIIARKKFINIR
jgi:hypothetical protein